MCIYYYNETMISYSSINQQGGLVMLRPKVINVLYELHQYQAKAQMEFNRDGKYYSYDNIIEELRYSLEFINITQLKNYFAMLEHSKDLPIGSCCPWCGAKVTSLHRGGCELEELIIELRVRVHDEKYKLKFIPYQVEIWIDRVLREVLEIDISSAKDIYSKGILTSYALSRHSDISSKSIKVEINKIG